MHIGDFRQQLRECRQQLTAGDHLIGAAAGDGARQAQQGVADLAALQLDGQGEGAGCGIKVLREGEDGAAPGDMAG